MRNIHEQSPSILSRRAGRGPSVLVGVEVLGYPLSSRRKNALERKAQALAGVDGVQQVLGAVIAAYMTLATAALVSALSLAPKTRYRSPTINEVRIRSR